MRPTSPPSLRICAARKGRARSSTVAAPTLPRFRWRPAMFMDTHEPQAMPGRAARDDRDRAQALPTGHQLAAAARAASVLSHEGTRIADARDSYTGLPSGGIYRAADLVRGERLLVSLGLLCEEDGLLYPTTEARILARLSDTEGAEMLLALLLEREPPLWLTSVTAGDEVALEYVPDE